MTFQTAFHTNNTAQIPHSSASSYVQCFRTLLAETTLHVWQVKRQMHSDMTEDESSAHIRLCTRVSIVRWLTPFLTTSYRIHSTIHSSFNDYVPRRTLSGMCLNQPVSARYQSQDSRIDGRWLGLARCTPVRTPMCAQLSTKPTKSLRPTANSSHLKIAPPYWSILNCIV